MLSGYDSESTGFESVANQDKTEANSTTQTTEFSSNDAASQAFSSNAVGSQASLGNAVASQVCLSNTIASQASLGVASASQASSSKHCNIQTVKTNPDVTDTQDYAGLNAFLKRVIPTVMDALDNNERDFLNNSSDSDEEETVHATLFQLLDNFDIAEEHNFGSGDQKRPSVLSVSWSSPGNTLAVSLGRTDHDDWCEHAGLIRVYTVKRSADDKLCHLYDITQYNCVTLVQYHPGIAALLAYATAAGEVVVRSLRNATSAGMGDGAYLTSPAGCHGSRRVSALQWADPHLTSSFLTMQITTSAKRRGASDQILISAGCDGTINVWQVNANLDIFCLMLCYQLYGASPGKQIIPDITCFDFIRLMESHPDVPDDVFVVGCKSGQLILCNMKRYAPIIESSMVDPTFGSVDPHSSCVLNVAFSNQRPGIFASISTDSDLRVYSISQSCPLNIFCMDDAFSCMAWVPNNPCLVVVGLGKVEGKGQILKIYNVASGKQMAIEGLGDDDKSEAIKAEGQMSATAIAINYSCQNRIAVGDSEGRVYVWDIPVQRFRLSGEDYEF